MTNPLLRRNSENSALVKAVALSDTITSGKPRPAKVFLISSMVAVDIDKFVEWISSHLECASTMRRNILPSKGPA